MSITLFGVIWIILCIYYTFWRPFKSLLCLFLFSFVMQASAVLMVGEQAVVPSVVTGCFVILKYLINGHFKWRLSRTPASRAMLIYFVVIVAVSLVSSVSFRGVEIIEGDNTLRRIVFDGELGLYRFVVVGIYGLCFSIFAQTKGLWEASDVSNLIYRTSYLVLGVGIVQVLIGFEIIPKIPLFGDIFYSNINTASYYSPHEDVTRRLYATFIEPSYCAGFLCGTFWYIYALQERSIRRKLVLATLLLEILLTFSTTAYVAFAVGAVIYIAINRAKKLPKSFVMYFALVVTVLIIVIQTTPILDPVIDKIVGSFHAPETYNWYGQTVYIGSESIRTQWNINAMDLFKRTNGFGIGYSVVRASSLIPCILAQIGVIGTLAFVNLNARVFKDVKKYGADKQCGAAVILLMACVLISQIVACPDLDFCVFWQGLFLCLAVAGIAKQQNTATEVAKGVPEC